MLPYGRTATNTEPSQLHFGRPDDGLDAIRVNGRFVDQGPVQEAADAVLAAHKAKVAEEMARVEAGETEAELHPEAQVLYPGYKGPAPGAAAPEAAEKRGARASHTIAADVEEKLAKLDDEDGNDAEVQIVMSAEAQEAMAQAEVEEQIAEHASNIQFTPEQQAMLEAAKTQRTAASASADGNGEELEATEATEVPMPLPPGKTPMAGGVSALLGGMDPLTPAKAGGNAGDVPSSDDDADAKQLGEGAPPPAVPASAPATAPVPVEPPSTPTPTPTPAAAPVPAEVAAADPGEDEPDAAPVSAEADDGKDVAARKPRDSSAAEAHAIAEAAAAEARAEISAELAAEAEAEAAKE